MSTPQDIDITVLVPAHNAGKYIREAIQSVLDQTFLNFELLIINDGSTDDTEQIINSFNDERIVVLHIKHSGVSSALNSGLSAARGRYIARFDADDLCMPGRLKKQYDFLEANSDYILTGSDAIYITEDGKHLFNFTCAGHEDHEIRRDLYVFCPVIHSAVMYRKAAVINAGGYSLHAHNFEDYLLWVQLAAVGKLHNIPEQLIRVRFNPSSVTMDEKWRGDVFRKLKRSIIIKGSISEEEGNRLQNIISRQDTRAIKAGAYHALCGKKFLTDNYQPLKARKHFLQSIHSTPYRWDSYALYVISFLPQTLLDWLHRKSPNKL
jgi:glycosyltransferase involved in cell wall biosynthesis